MWLTIPEPYCIVVKKMDRLTREVAADDASWGLGGRLSRGVRVHREGGGGRRLIATGKGAGQVGLGLAEGLATLLRWTPYILGGDDEIVTNGGV